MKISVLVHRCGNNVVATPCTTGQVASRLAALKAIDNAETFLAEGDEDGVIEDMKNALQNGEYQKVCDIYDDVFQLDESFEVREQEVIDEKSVDRYVSPKWKKKLHSGDEITVSVPTYDPVTVVIGEIEYLEGNLVKIRTRDGENIQCNLDEIS